MSHDLAIIGAGPAGTSAAIEAAALGLSVVLIDEQPDAGGQVWRAPSPGITPPPNDPGAALRARLRETGVTCAFGRRVWLVERGFTVSALGPDGPETYQARALISAAGAEERHLPIPGWTLPGVIGLAAATILLKSHRILPGRRVAVAGAGPLLPLVASAILSGGGEIAAVIDANPRRAWLTPALLSQPALAARGAFWLARLLAAGIPLLSGHALRRIDGDDQAAGIVAGPVDAAFAPGPGRERRFACDAVCYGFGLQPATAITRLLGASHAWRPALGGWVPQTTGDQATSIPLLYACGDGAGVLGAAAAPLRGRIAARAAARALGMPSPATSHRRLRRASRFGAAMTALTAPRPGAAAAITAETIICRCERLPRSTLDAAIAEGAVTLNDLKSATRCGMGPCGGRLCEHAAALLIATRTGRGLETIEPPTARPPLRPIAIAALAGDFDYASLPMPEPAPL